MSRPLQCFASLFHCWLWSTPELPRILGNPDTCVWRGLSCEIPLVLETLTVFTSARAHEKYPWAYLGDCSEHEPNGCDSSPFARVMLESVQHEKTNQLPVAGVFVGLGPGKFKDMRVSQGWDSGLCLKGSTPPHERCWHSDPQNEMSPPSQAPHSSAVEFRCFGGGFQSCAPSFHLLEGTIYSPQIKCSALH